MSDTKKQLLRLMRKKLPDNLIDAFLKVNKFEAVKLLDSVKTMGKQCCKDDFYLGLRIVANTLLHEACRHSWFDIADTLISEFKYEVSILNSSRHTPLHEACKIGDFEFVQKLIGHHKFATICEENPQKNFLQTALESSNYNIVTLLVTEGRCNPNKEGVNLLTKICEKDQLEMLMSLVEDHNYKPALGQLSVYEWTFRKSVVKLCEKGNAGFVKYLSHVCQGFDLWVRANACYLLDIKTCNHEILEFLILQEECDPNVLVNGSTVLVQACEANDLAMVEFLMEKCKCDPTHRYDSYSVVESPIIAACRSGNTKIFLYLISKLQQSYLCKDEMADHLLSITDVKHTGIIKVLLQHAKTETSEIFHKACATGDLTVVRDVVKDCDFKCTTIVSSVISDSPLYAACEACSLDVINYLLMKHECRLNFRGQEEEMVRLLIKVIKNGKLDVVKFLVEKCDFDSQTIRNSEELFYCACTTGDVETVQYLLKACKINEARLCFDTVFIEAWKTKNLQLVKYLLASFGLKQMLNFNVFLKIYINNEDFPLIKYLIESGYIDPRAVEPKSLLFILQSACRADDVDALEFLAEIFTDTFPSKYEDESLCSLLLAGCSNRKFNCVRHLLNFLTEGSKTCKCDKILNVVYAQGYDNIIEHLINSDVCDPQGAIDENNNTLLHLACGKGDLWTVQFLLEQRRVSMVQQNIDDQIPLQQAVSANHLNVIEYMLTSHECSGLFKYLPTDHPFLVLQLAYKQQNITFFKYMVENGLVSPNLQDEKGNTLLHSACYSSDLEMVKYLTEKSKQSLYLKIKNSNGDTPIHEACKSIKISTEMMKYVLSLNSSYFCCNKSGLTPLHSAVENRNYFLAYCLIMKLESFADERLLHLLLECEHQSSQLLQFLLERSTFSPHSLDHNGETAFQKACINGNIYMLEYFTRDGNFDLSQHPTIIYETVRRKQSDVILFFATKLNDSFLSITKKDQKILTLMFENFPPEIIYEVLSEVNSMNLKDYEKNTILHLACSAGKFTLVQKLIDDFKLSPMEPNRNGKTALHNACSSGHSDIVEYIINLSDKSKDDSYKEDISVLFCACKSKNKNLCELLVSRGCSYLMKDAVGNSLLHIACENKNFIMVKYLIDILHCNPTQKNDEGLTPFELACKTNYLPIVKFLIELTECKDLCKSSKTIVHYSFNECSENAIQFYKVLRDVGCSLTTPDDKGNTLLHRSGKMYSFSKFILFLINCGCDPLKPNFEGKSFLTLAIENYNSINACCWIKSYEFKKIQEAMEREILFYIYDRQSVSIEHLVKQGFNPKATDHDGSTLLHKACMKGHLSMVKVLVEKCKCTDLILLCVGDKNQKRSPLEIAMNCSTTDIFQYLLQWCDSVHPIALLEKPNVLLSLSVLKFLMMKYQCNPKDVIDFNGKNILHKACQDCNLELVKFLIEECKFDTLATNWNDMTALHVAVETAALHCSGGNAVVKYLIETHGGSQICKRPCGREFVIKACKSGNSTLVKILIRGGCTVDVPYTITHAVCANGNLDLLKVLLTGRRYLLSEVEGKNHYTPIHCALTTVNNFPIINYLLQNFAQDFKKASTRSSELHSWFHDGQFEDSLQGSSLKCSTPLLNCAYEFQTFQMIKLLIEKGQCNPRTEDKDGVNLLHLACSAGDLLMVRYLIEKMKCEPKQKDHNKLNCLNKACASGNVALVLYLLESCDMRDTRYDEPPVHSAVKNKQYNVFNVLLKQGFELNSYDSNHNSLLHSACKIGNIPLLHMLKSVLPSEMLSVNKKGQTPFHLACEKKDPDLLNFLLANYDFKCQEFIRSDFLHAAYSFHSTERIHVIKILVTNAGCNVDSKDSKGNTILHLAASSGDFIMCQVLYEEFECKIFVKNDKNLTPFNCACNSFNLKTIQYLASKYESLHLRSVFETALPNLQLEGATLTVMKYLIQDLECDPYHVGKGKNTLLHRACAAGNNDAVRYLMGECEFNCFQCNSNGATPLHLACEKGASEIVSFLIETCNIQENKHHLDDILVKCYEELSVEECKTEILELLVKNAFADGGCNQVEQLLIKSLTDKKLYVTKCILLRCGIENVSHLNLLKFCCRHKNYESLRYLITECGCDPSKYEWSERMLNPLTFACQRGDEGLIRYLHKKSSSQNLIKEHAKEALETAFKNDTDNIVIYLLKECGLDSSNSIITFRKCYKGRRLKLLEWLCTNSSKTPMYDESKCQTLLHYACSKSDIEMVKTLIEKCNCSTSMKDKNGNTPLYCAKDPDVIKYLVTEGKVDLTCTGAEQNTPLHLVCSQRTVCVPAFEYILSTGDVDPLQQNRNGQTALQLFKERHVQLSYQKLVDQLKDFKVSHPVDSFVNILILGHPGAGKSTLTCAMIKKTSKNFFLFGGSVKEKDVMKNTAGIVPSILKDSTLQNIIVHDFAGHIQYHSSHLTIIDYLLRKSSAVFVLVLNLTDDDRFNHLQYWLTLIDAKRKIMKIQSKLIIVASHKDKKTDKQVGEEKIKIIEHMACRKYTSELYEIIAHDCRSLLNARNPFIRALFDACQLIRESPQFELSLYCYTLYAFLEQLKKEDSKRTAYTLDKLKEKIRDHPVYSHCLPKEFKELSKAFEMLDSIGLIIFLPDTMFLSNSWVIVDKGQLLTQINGIIFFTKDMENMYFKKYPELASNTGVVASRALKEVCDELDLTENLVIKFLLQMDLCRKIPPGFFKFSTLNARDTAVNEDETFLFFPALNSTKECPDEIKGRRFRFGWVMRCTENQFFLPNFMHSLILRLSSKYAIESNLFSESVFPSIHRQCNIWKNGIHWIEPSETIDALRVHIEFFESGQSLIFLLSGSGKDMKKRCKDIIRDILYLHETEGESKQYKEYLIDPEDLDYPLKTFNALKLYDIKTVTVCILTKNSSVLNSTGRHSQSIRELIAFEDEETIFNNPKVLTIYAGRDLKELAGIRAEVTEDKPVETYLNIGDLKHVLMSVRSVDDWMMLGVFLGLPQPKLQQIEKTNNNDHDRCMLGMLSMWLMSSKECTWSVLVKTLRELNLNALADEIQSSVRTTTQPTQSQPETCPQTTEIKAIVSCIKKELDANYSNLKSVFQVSMEQVSDEMFTVGLISIAVKKKQSYDALIGEFHSGFLFMKELPQVEQHCKKFFDVFYKLGGSFVIAGDVLKQSITQTIKDKFNLNLSFD